MLIFYFTLFYKRQLSQKIYHVCLFDRLIVFYFSSAGKSKRRDGLNCAILSAAFPVREKISGAISVKTIFEPICERILYVKRINLAKLLQKIVEFLF